MTRRFDAIRKQQGFSLLEILVAFTILVMSLVVITEVFSTGLRSVASAINYQQVASYAGSKLAELRVSDSLTAGTETGRFNESYQWQAIVKEPAWSDKKLPFKVYEITLTVLWKEQHKDKTYTVSTIGLVHT
ncbi:type IV pilus modification PilV family protein [Kaarinaea lacus]